MIQESNTEKSIIGEDSNLYENDDMDIPLEIINNSTIYEESVQNSRLNHKNIKDIEIINQNDSNPSINPFFNHYKRGRILSDSGSDMESVHSFHSNNKDKENQKDNSNSKPLSKKIKYSSKKKEESKDILQHKDLLIVHSNNLNKKLLNPDVKYIIDHNKKQTSYDKIKKTYKDGDVNMDLINQVRIEYPHAGISKIPFGTIFKYVNRLVVEKGYTNIPEEKRIEIVHLAQQLLDEQNNQKPQALLDDVYGHHSDSESEIHQNGKKQLNKIIKINKLKDRNRRLLINTEEDSNNLVINKAVLEGIIKKVLGKKHMITTRTLKEQPDEQYTDQSDKLIYSIESDSVVGKNKLEETKELNNQLQNNNQLESNTKSWGRVSWNPNTSNENNKPTKIVSREEAIAVDENGKKVNKKPFKKTIRKLKNKQRIENNLPKLPKIRDRRRVKKALKKQKELEEKKTAELNFFNEKWTTEELNKLINIRAVEREKRAPSSWFNDDQSVIEIVDEQGFHDNNSQVTKPNKWRKIIESETYIREQNNDIVTQINSEDIDYEDGPEYIVDRISLCTDTYSGDASEATEVDKDGKKRAKEEKEARYLDDQLEIARMRHAQYEVNNFDIVDQTQRKKIQNKIKEIPANHFELHLNKDWFRTDLIEIKNRILFEMHKPQYYMEKKAIVYTQAGSEHFFTFLFSLSGLFFVLGTKIATQTHLKLFKAIVELFSMHNPTLPIDRALNGYQDDFNEFSREEEELKRKRLKKQEYNQNYKKKRQANNKKMKEGKLRQEKYINDFEERIKKNPINKKKKTYKEKMKDIHENEYIDISSNTSSPTSSFESDSDYEFDYNNEKELIDMVQLQKEANEDNKDEEHKDNKDIDLNNDNGLLKMSEEQINEKLNKSLNQVENKNIVEEKKDDLIVNDKETQKDKKSNDLDDSLPKEKVDVEVWESKLNEDQNKLESSS